MTYEILCRENDIKISYSDEYKQYIIDDYYNDYRTIFSYLDVNIIDSIFIDMMKNPENFDIIHDSTEINTRLESLPTRYTKFSGYYLGNYIKVKRIPIIYSKFIRYCKPIDKKDITKENLKGLPTILLDKIKSNLEVEYGRN